MSIFRLLKINEGGKYPVGDRLYYRCILCGANISSMPDSSRTCECGNISIDVVYGTLLERRRGTIQLMRKIA
jgi:hypothetical protein